jgi:hypothetical protein
MNPIKTEKVKMTSKFQMQIREYYIRAPLRRNNT